jgi:hypothetical protein
VQVFTFSAANLTNIWAGVGARMWAVSPEQAANASIQGKARKFQVGSLGIFYCVLTKSVTTPFLVSSAPRFGHTVSNVWPESWELSFGIVPLGSPHKRLTVSSLGTKLPSLAGGKQWTTLFTFQPVTVFAASQLQSEDWAVLVGELADT